MFARHAHFSGTRMGQFFAKVQMHRYLLSYNEMTVYLVLEWCRELELGAAEALFREGGVRRAQLRAEVRDAVHRCVGRMQMMRNCVTSDGSFVCCDGTRK